MVVSAGPEERVRDEGFDGLVLLDGDFAAALGALDAEDRRAIGAALPALERLVERLREPPAEEHAA